MTYSGIDRKRYANLLDLGVDDGELRKFFADCRVQLIQKGAKVQNPPHGKSARVRMLAQGLPQGTDKIVQRWFSENLTMVDPETVGETVTALRLYEEIGEMPADQEARRLARSCLVHLFAAEPDHELISFLRPKNGGTHGEQQETKELLPVLAKGVEGSFLSPALVSALIALEDRRDPDEHLSSLPATMASLIAGIHAIRVGNDDEAKAALAALVDYPALQQLLTAHASRSVNAVARRSDDQIGLQFIDLLEAEGSIEFDFDRDEVVAVCTSDASEKVFLRPFAIRTAGGSWLSLARRELRERIFWTSGDLLSFPAGRDFPRQPKRWEVGIWGVAENKASRSSVKTNFHIVGQKIPVFDVVGLPFSSTDYDGVRESIKHYVETAGAESARTTLFLLRDGLIVGCPSGRDLTRDEGFEAGLPSWRALQALRIDGRPLVPGPLPRPDTYECEALASSLKKLLEKDDSPVDRLTQAQRKRIQQLITSGQSHLNAARADRLRAELQIIDEHAGAMDVLLNAVMEQPTISQRVDRLVQEKVDALVSQKEDLRTGIEKLKKEQADLTAKRKRMDGAQRAMAPAVAKAIRTAFDKARNDAIDTLGQVAVFKALVDEVVDRPSQTAQPNQTSLPQSGLLAVRAVVRTPRLNFPTSPTELLRRLGIAPKHAEALNIVEQLARASGLFLLVDGLAARLAAEGWLTSIGGVCKVLECRVGLMDGSQIEELLEEPLGGIAVLDANLSPLDVYGRPLIDAMQKRIVGLDEQSPTTLTVLSLSKGVAALPVPQDVGSIAIKVSLDCGPQFLPESDALQLLEGLAELDEVPDWIAGLWKPAQKRILSNLRAMTPADVALALSVLNRSKNGLISSGTAHV